MEVDMNVLPISRPLALEFQTRISAELNNVEIYLQSKTHYPGDAFYEIYEIHRNRERVYLVLTIFDVDEETDPDFGVCGVHLSQRGWWFTKKKLYHEVCEAIIKCNTN
jgi:hypothetical protein